VQVLPRVKKTKKEAPRGGASHEDSDTCGRCAGRRTALRTSCGKMCQTITVIGKGEAYRKHHLPAIKQLGLEEVEDGEIYTISTPNYMHVPFALYALEKGKKVILEKPIATNLEDAKLLMAHPKADSIAVCYQRRFDTQAQQIKHYPAKIRSINCRMVVRRDNYYWQTWRKDNIKSGGGALINIFIHYLDTIQWWLGKKYIIDFAKIAERGGIDQVIDAKLDFNGVPATFFGSSIHTERDNGVVVEFEDGTFMVYDKEDATHFDIYEQFLKHNNYISVKDAYASLEIVQAIYEYNRNHA
jgi:predicted dehydrogenase